MRRCLWCTVLPALFAVACGTGEPAPVAGGGAGEEPRAAREFRAAWVASVNNINWPSEPGLPPDSQRAEAVALLDLLERLHFNAVIFQVRPQADALYPSDIEPWSYYLTGEQGRPPDPAWDPLEFWIEEAHDRGLELHAWLNPYRAHHPEGGPLTATSLVRRRPDLVVPLSEGYWWMNPALEQTQELSLSVVMDIVRRYDVDGIHFDDYFYPYPSYNADEDFPDEESWNAYVETGGELSRGDWRRDAVNTFIRDIYRAIKAEKPHVKFGLSPFGIWRPGNPRSIEGFDQYAELYADARLWLNEGWIDYWTPQLYWPISQIPQSYPVLLGWWVRENTQRRHLWPGMSIGRVPGARGAIEVVNQIMITRGMLPDDPGNVHWSIGPLITSDTLADALFDGPYREQALVPSSPWLDDRAPAAPTVRATRSASGIVVRWEHPDPEDVFRWVVSSRAAEEWSYRIVGRQERQALIPHPAIDSLGVMAGEQAADSLVRIDRIAVSAVDRTGNESPLVFVEMPDSAVETSLDPLLTLRPLPGSPDRRRH